MSLFQNKPNNKKMRIRYVLLLIFVLADILTLIDSSYYTPLDGKFFRSGLKIFQQQEKFFLQV